MRPFTWTNRIKNWPKPLSAKSATSLSTSSLTTYGGHPTEVLLDALTGHDLKAEATRIRLVEIGEMAGPTIALSAAALRSSGLELYGSGGRQTPPPGTLHSFLLRLELCPS